MRKLLGLILPILLATGLITAAVAADPPPVTYAGQTTTHYFGDGNLPPGCIRDMARSNPDNRCFHMRTGLNALDSPQIDVLILAPASPLAERDLRIMRQSVEMWAGGIEKLSGEMGMAWLKDVDFHISADVLDGEFSTYPLYDPEIVVIASNPIGGIGIGVDPLALAGELGLYGADGVPCTTIENPFDIEAWEALPGYDSHHDGRTGTYIEDCGGAGGNVCFSVNGAIDPVPGMTEVFSLFDLLTHEFGHCLTVGHVGDGAEGDWGVVPTNDIMSYNEDPPLRTKCVSSLDVEGFALRMSNYLDRNRDGKVTAADRLLANDVPGDGRNAFQVQSPNDHVYASSSGAPEDCPQPDVGLVPGGKTDWGPSRVASTRPELDLTRFGRDGDRMRVGGTVSYVPVGKQPTKANGSVSDAAGDARSPFNDIRRVDVKVTNTHVEGTIAVSRLWPVTTAASSGAAYNLIVNGRRFDSMVNGNEVTTYDNGAEEFVEGISRWDAARNEVHFSIPRRYLEGYRNVAPYYVSGAASVQNAKRVVFVDDVAPAGAKRIAVTGRPLKKLAAPQTTRPRTGTTPYTEKFKAEDGNTFAVTTSNGGLGSLVSDPHVFSTQVTSPSKVEISLTWDDPFTDLGLSAQPGAGEIAYGSGSNPTTVVFDEVRGPVSIEVNPNLVGPTGVTYQLTAKVTPIGPDTDRDGLTDPGDRCPKQRGPLPSGCPDADRDGVADIDDDCPKLPAGTANGCPAAATEWIQVFVDGKRVSTTRVDRELGIGRFAVTMPALKGRHTVRTVWVNRKGTIASVTRRIG